MQQSLSKLRRECRNRQSVQETWKAKERESLLCLGSRVFIDDCGLVHMSSQASRNGLNKDRVQMSIVSH